MLNRFKSVIALAIFLASSFIALAQPLLLIDMENGEVLFERDAGAPWHPASLTKMMTALVVFQAIDNGRVTLQTPVITSANALKAPPSKIGFPKDTAVTMDVALHLIWVKSANDISIAVAETVSGSEEKFVAEMNNLAQVLGLSATNFVNPHGLHDVRQVTSARDMAILAQVIRRNYPQYRNMFATSYVELGGKLLQSNNNLLTEFRGTTGMKTGFVCSAGLNIAVSLERQGRQLIAIVLGASSGRERGEQAGQLLIGALRGSLSGAGKHVAQIANNVGQAPVDMRPRLCGAQAKTYAAQREAAFPYGLNGEASFLTDSIAPRTFKATVLGRLRDVPLPRKRPTEFLDYITPKNSLALPVPLPKPRPTSAP